MRSPGSARGPRALFGGPPKRHIAADAQFDSEAVPHVSGGPPQTARGPRALPGVFAAALFIAMSAQAASPVVSAITPPGGQRGGEVDVVLAGERLSDARGFLFFSPGIEVTNLESADEKKLKAHLKIAADCPLGEHALRVWTATGVSDVNTFQVGPFPSVSEAEPNNDAAQAQPVALNNTINGVIKDEDIDFVSVELKKGQRLTAVVEGMRLGQTLFDPCVAIMTKDGRELTANDDNSLLLQDPIASIIAPEDGTYLVAVRESTWGGNEKSAYRLHVGTFPQPLAVYPPGGPAGEKINVTFFGDIAGPISQAIALPERIQNPKSKIQNLFAEQDSLIAPAANLIRVSPFPNVLEVEPNNDTQHATGTDKAPPFAINGAIGEKGDTDFFKFAAKKGEEFEVNVYARRLRSPLDSVLTIFDAQGKRLASNDDSNGTDSYLRFKVPADGSYCIAVADQLKRGGLEFVYRVEVTAVAPDIALTIPEMVKDTQERQAVALPRGNRFGALIRAKRSDFGGDIVLDANGLPGGVAIRADAMAGGVDTLPVVFEAAADAQVSGTLCEIAAHPADAGNTARGHYAQAIDLVLGQPNNTPYYKTSVEKMAVAVSEEAPFKIEIVQPKAPMVQNGSMNLKVVAERLNGFKGAINLSMLWNPPGVGAQATVTIPPDKTEATIPLSANGDAQKRKWKTAVVGSADTGRGVVWVSSQLADLEIAPPFVTARIERAYTEQGEPATVTCRLTQSVLFEGKAKVQLLGLPNKVTAPEVEITSADQEVRFEVATDKTSPTGQHKSLFCQVTIMKDGEPIVATTGQGGVLRIDKAAKEVVAK